MRIRWLSLDVPPTPDLTAESRRWMIAQGRRDLFRRTSSSLVVYPLLTILLAIASGVAWTHPRATAALVLVQCGIAGVRAAMHRRMRASPRAEHRWLPQSIGLGIVSASLLACVGAAVFVIFGHSPAAYFSELVVAGYAAAAASMGALHRRMTRCVILVCVVPFLVAFALRPGDAAALLLLNAVFALVLWRLVDHAHESYWRAQMIGARLQAQAEEHLRLSRFAGMAEIATNILHDVGNALNSVKTSSRVLADEFDRIDLGDVSKLVDLLEQHRGQLGPFFERDARGAMLVPFLKELVAHWCERQTAARAELARLHKLVDHIATIVARQQDHARFGSQAETVALQELARDALGFVGTPYDRAGVTLELVPGAELSAEIDRHRAVQILVNLLKNALEAVAGRDDARVIVRTELRGGASCIVVEDNGCGISSEDAARIFAHGFTTKAHGHGFGLHSSLLGARAMGGELSFTSAGKGCGACFVLALPRLRSRLATAA